MTEMKVLKVIKLPSDTKYQTVIGMFSLKGGKTVYIK